jgi:LemA protein
MFLILAIVVVIVFVIAIYNKLIKMRNHADEAWSDIDVQLKRRYNLIPNIVEAVKGYAAHEEGVFTKVTEARSNAINAGNLKEQAQAENMLSGALKSLFAVAENYPELKANENFMQLQNELVDTEDKIQAARRFYNGTVRDFNTKIQQFPNSIIASMFKFEAKEFFEVEDEEQKEVVKVSFDKEEKKEEEKPTEPAPAPAAEEPTPPVAPVTPVTPPEETMEEKPEEKVEEKVEEIVEEKKEETAEPTPELPIEKPTEEEKKEEIPAPTPAEPAAPEEEAKPEEKKEEEDENKG